MVDCAAARVDFIDLQRAAGEHVHDARGGGIGDHEKVAGLLLKIPAAADGQDAVAGRAVTAGVHDEARRMREGAAGDVDDARAAAAGVIARVKVGGDVGRAAALAENAEGRVLIGHGQPAGAVERAVGEHVSAAAVVCAIAPGHQHPLPPMLNKPPLWMTAPAAVKPPLPPIASKLADEVTVPPEIFSYAAGVADWPSTALPAAPNEKLPPVPTLIVPPVVAPFQPGHERAHVDRARADVQHGLAAVPKPEIHGAGAGKRAAGDVDHRGAVGTVPHAELAAT